MKCKKNFYFLIILVVTLMFTGCALRRVPNPTTDSNMEFNLPGGGNRISPHDNFSPGWENSIKIGENIKGQIVNVPGVKDATVVVYNTSAYVGVETDGKENLDDNNKDNQGLLDQVAKKAKETEGTITTVYVSTDKDFMQKINEINDSIKTGLPKGNFKNEMDELVKNMQPIK